MTRIKLPHKNDRVQDIACVTGASGMVGSSISNMLNNQGIHVRLLMHKQPIMTDFGEIYQGDLDDESTLESFLRGAELLFHCAGEIRNPDKIWQVNVEGTKTLFKAAKKLKIKYFCHISSAGVFGLKKSGWIDEDAKCQPANLYEESKLAAEQIVNTGIEKGRVVILRPTNVVAEKHHGILEVITKRNIKNRLKLLVVGNECAHAVHADNIAAAALHCMKLPFSSTECYIVSCDNELETTFAELDQLYSKIVCGKTERIRFKKPLLPIVIPFLIRKCIGREGNMGNVKYSSKKLFESGFTFPVDLESTMRRIACAEAEKNENP